VIVGLVVLWGFYLIWNTVRAFHERVEGLLRERLLGEEGGSRAD
jgi:hypothetical protein